MESKQLYLEGLNLSNDVDLARKAVEMITGSDIFASNRKRSVVESRMIFSSMLRDMGYSLVTIGNVLKKDHTTIIHYLRKIKELIEVDGSLLKKYLKCRQIIILKEQPVNLIDDISILKGEIEMLKLQNFLLTEEKNEMIKQCTVDDSKRLSRIFKLIEQNTPLGYENIMERKLIRLFCE
jgi:hypothetical protein